MWASGLTAVSPVLVISLRAAGPAIPPPTGGSSRDTVSRVKKSCHFKAICRGRKVSRTAPRVVWETLRPRPRPASEQHEGLRVAGVRKHVEDPGADRRETRHVGDVGGQARGVAARIENESNPRGVDPRGEVADSSTRRVDCDDVGGAQLARGRQRVSDDEVGVDSCGRGRRPRAFDGLGGKLHPGHAAARAAQCKAKPPTPQ